MKNQAIQYLALDVHQATTVATLRNESGAIVMRATVATEAKATGPAEERGAFLAIRQAELLRFATPGRKGIRRDGLARSL